MNAKTLRDAGIPFDWVSGLTTNPLPFCFGLRTDDPALDQWFEFHPTTQGIRSGGLRTHPDALIANGSAFTTRPLHQ
jgi:hypothetical protein